MRRALARARDGKPLDQTEAEVLLHARGDDLRTLLGYAARTRDAGLEAAGRPGIITYSKKVFIPLTRLCRDRCGYCTFATVPGRLDSPFLSPDEVLEIARQGAALGCKEALFTLGDRPEARWKQAREWLDAHGYDDTLSYVRAMAIRVLEETGLLPHLNPGVMTWQDFQRLKPVAPSMGMMLETTAERLFTETRALRTSARPTRTPRSACGSWRTRAAATSRSPPASSSASARRWRSASTRSSRCARCPASTTASRKSSCRTSAPSRTPRCATPPTRNSRTSPPRSRSPGSSSARRPASRRRRTSSATSTSSSSTPGIDDWGGVSPLTPDHVNPERPWPQIDELAALTAAAGFTLRERLTIYPPYIREPWLDPRVAAHVAALADPATGLADEAALPQACPWQEPDGGWGESSAVRSARVDRYDRPHRGPPRRLQRGLR